MKRVKLTGILYNAIIIGSLIVALTSGCKLV
ncbi:hypothetical protein MGA3_00410 [Bacillus methanolicus MGA3]|uniref:Putative membrane protein n=1 Tax=Bacillus methanolicus (strain MGA3 / ATCC 53907) TaxID=796606 RepID=I3EB49_BACMM|nr:putative membrane protein [Bacillus methanolicus MGA3]EIJ83720.1 hypothetical protein MGA3_00410 [Bacillus methanolicus MGA3]